MHSFMAFNCSSRQLVLKLGFFSTLYFSSGRETCKDEATESMLGLEDLLSFWEGGLVQDISSVVGNVKGEGVDEFNRSQLFRKELVFPSHSTVKMSFCSRSLSLTTDTRLTSCLRVEKGLKPPCAVCFKITSFWEQPMVSVIQTYDF